MCGRYVVNWTTELFKETFNLAAPEFESYNLAPTQIAPVIYAPRGHRELLNARWGLVPSWVSKPIDFKANLFNARAETLNEKGSFRKPFKKQRCLVPASGFYEWKTEGKTKTPHYIHASKPLAFAGLYEHWQKEGQGLDSFTIITTTPSDFMAKLHNRMPVILDPEYFDLWLDPESESEMLEHLLKPYSGELSSYPVDKRVGRVSENDPTLLAAIS